MNLLLLIQEQPENVCITNSCYQDFVGCGFPQCDAPYGRSGYICQDTSTGSNKCFDRSDYGYGECNGHRCGGSWCLVSTNYIWTCDCRTTLCYCNTM